MRVIAPDRPGFGASDPQPGRRFGDWPDDVFALADHLGVERFRVAGHSGGGPHALALALDSRSRVGEVFAIASAAPWEAGGEGLGLPFRLVRRLSKSSPRLLHGFLRSHSKSLREAPDTFLRDWGRMSAPEGRLFGERPELAQLIVAEMDEGYRQGVEAAVEEAALYYGEWGLALGSNTTPVHLIYGGADVQAPVRWGEYLVAELGNATLEILADEGHFTTLVASAAKVLDACC